jgi:hypothetical protein
MSKTCNPSQNKQPENRIVCIHCKQKYKILIEQFLNHEIGIKELKDALRIYNAV